MCIVTVTKVVSYRSGKPGAIRRPVGLFQHWKHQALEHRFPDLTATSKHHKPCNHLQMDTLTRDA